MRGAPTVGGVAGELRSLHGLSRLPAGHRRRVDQPQAVAPRGRDPRQVAEQGGDLRGELSNSLVEARLAGDVGEEVTEPAAGEAQEAPLLGAVEQHLGDGEADHLGVADLRLAPRSGWVSPRQEIVGEDVKCLRRSSRSANTWHHLRWSTLLRHADLRRLSFARYLPDRRARRLGISDLVEVDPQPIASRARVICGVSSGGGPATSSRTIFRRPVISSQGRKTGSGKWEKCRR